MRRPFVPKGTFGIKRFFILQLTIGLTLLNALFHLPVLIILIWLSSTQAWNDLPLYLPSVFIVSLAVSYFAGIFIGILGAMRAGKPKLILSVIWMPLYWLALFLPTLHALWELGRRPFFWHKTQHGVRGPLDISNINDSPPSYDTIA